MRRSPFFWAVVLLFVLPGAARLLAHVVIDGLWFSAVGHGETFRTMITAQVLAALVAGGVAAGAALASGIAALRRSPERAVTPSLRGTPLGEQLRQPGGLERIVLAVAAVVGLAAGGLGLARWTDLVAWWHGASFGLADPVLGLDVGFHVFALPVVELAHQVLLLGASAALVVAVAVYLARGEVRVSVPDAYDRQAQATLIVPAAARRHLALLASGVVLLVAVRFHLLRYARLAMPGERFDGPGYAIVHAELPLLTLQAVATALAAFLVFQGVDRLRGGPLVLAAVLATGAGAARSMVPGAVQRLVVAPNELDVEAPYLGAHVRATRVAWGLDAVEERSLSASAGLTWEDIERNRTTIDSIRLWDHDALLETFRQVQEIRTQYEFVRVDNDRYVIDGQLRQTMLSARELLPTSLDGAARTWVNQSLVYTHGYGLALGPVNAVTEEGLPLLWVKDLPPAVSHPDPLRIDQPAIYYGEAMDQPVFVRTGAREYDYPTADGNTWTTYEGSGGLPVGGLARRLLLALHLRDLNVLLASDLGGGSRVLLYRDVVARVQRLAPFVVVDPDPTMVVADGRLVWLVEGYTTSDRYPYSARRTLPAPGGRVAASYARNSVKATVDAYDGTVTLYAADEQDPILRAWAAALPRAVRPLDELSPTLRAHLRYPHALFEQQARLFATYHMTDVQVFYNREDVWQVPAVEGKAMEPYYTVMRLPGEEEPEFILMLPFTPRDKQNLSAWMVARSDGEQYGRLRVYRFPKHRLVYGPSQVDSRNQQDAGIREKLTLWNKGDGSRQAILGTLLVIPIESSLIYVQPLYLRSASGAIPELKRVIVRYEDDVTMQPTLDEALRELFGGPARTGRRAEAREADDGPAAPWQAHAQAAKRWYAAALDASAAGRWADFGAALDALGQALEALDAAEAGAAAAEEDEALRALRDAEDAAVE